MGAVPRHPFFLKAIDSLPEYNRKWVLPYITVMASTGPLYLSVIWRHYNNANPEGDDRIRILFPDEYNNHSWSFFTHHLGNSWHDKDVELIFWMARHWMVITFIGFALGFSVLGFVYAFFIKPRQNKSSNGHKSRFAYSRLHFNRRVNQKEIELNDRHEV
jgi:mannosyltransferase OCH1-like enzyme